MDLAQGAAAVARRGTACWWSLFLWASPAQAGLVSFVAQPDPSYQYVAGPPWQDGEATITEVQLTSQTFQGTPWQHILAIVRPRERVVADHVLLLVGGGRNDQLAPFGKAPGRTAAADLALLRQLALKSHMTVAMVEQVPNQPLFGDKMEDEAIAHTLKRYFQTGDDGWPLLEPMVKSVVRAMDTLQTISRTSWGHEITGFTLSGASKRAWTTWLTAAIDARVKAVAPLVFDMLNIKAQLAHQLQSWGTYSEQLGDYSAQGLPQMLGTPAGAKLLDIIDPFLYRDHLTQTKVIVLGTNDRYWPVDAASLYFDDLPGSNNYLLYVPNANHEANTPSIQDDRVALALAAAGQLQLPKFTGAFSLGGGFGNAAFALTSDMQPQAAYLWQASSSSRDFRNAKWRLVRKIAPGSRMAIPVTAQKGKWTAVFVAVQYQLGQHKQPFIVSSRLGLIPKS